MRLSSRRHDCRPCVANPARRAYRAGRGPGRRKPCRGISAAALRAAFRPHMYRNSLPAGRPASAAARHTGPASRAQADGMTIRRGCGARPAAAVRRAVGARARGPRQRSRGKATLRRGCGRQCGARPAVARFLTVTAWPCRRPGAGRRPMSPHLVTPVPLALPLNPPDLWRAARPA